VPFNTLFAQALHARDAFRFHVEFGVAASMINQHAGRAAAPATDLSQLN
jgi:hypothetical protein